jgi:hypothetical protein
MRLDQVAQTISIVLIDDVEIVGNTAELGVSVGFCLCGADDVSRALLLGELCSLIGFAECGLQLGFIGDFKGF